MKLHLSTLVLAFALLLSSQAYAQSASKQSNTKNSPEIALPAFVLGGKVELDCETRLTLLQPKDCPAGEGFERGESRLNIPKEPFRYQKKLNPTATKENQNRLNIFEIRI
jgi:hypothetical protein